MKYLRKKYLYMLEWIMELKGKDKFFKKINLL